MNIKPFRAVLLSLILFGVIIGSLSNCRCGEFTEEDYKYGSLPKYSGFSNLNETVTEVFIGTQPIGGVNVKSLSCSYTMYHHYKYTPPKNENTGYIGRSVLVNWVSDVPKDSNIVYVMDGELFETTGKDEPPEKYIDKTAVLSWPSNVKLKDGTYWLEFYTQELDLKSQERVKIAESNHVRVSNK